MADLKRLVTATNQLQQQLQETVEKLEQQVTCVSSPSTSSTTNCKQVVNYPQSIVSPPQQFQPTRQQHQLHSPLLQKHFQNSSTSLPQIQSSSQISGSYSGNVQSLSKPDKVSSEMSSLFHWNPRSTVGSNKKKRCNTSRTIGTSKKKMPSWTHTFICLASCSQDSIPDAEERALLQIAGLGEKKITFYLSSEALEIYEELLYQFPKLSQGGGFELLRIPEGGGKQVDVIPAPEAGYTVAYLKAVVHHAKVYIRPLQRDLCVEAEKQEVFLEPPKETCLTCGTRISITSMRAHITICRKQNVKEEELQTDRDVFLDNKNLEDTGHVPEDHPMHFPENAIVIDPDSPKSSTSLSDSANTFEQECFDHDMDVALALSRKEADLENNNPIAEPRTTADIVLSLHLNISYDKPFEMVVRRSDVLPDTLRRMNKLTFDPSQKLSVVFVGEQGCDGGGLTREFFRLIAHSVACTYMEPTGCFQHNSIAYQDSVFLKIGNLAAMALVHGGASFRIFCPTVYRFLCGVSASDLIASIDEVPDLSIQALLKEIESVGTVDQLRSLADENLDLLLECGYNKPVIKLELCDRVHIIQTISLHKVILSSMAELSQLKDGMSQLNVANTAKKYPDLLYSFYCSHYEDCITGDSIRKMFTKILYSEKGTNCRVSEERTYMFFIDFLDDCEKSEVKDETENEDHNETVHGASLKDVLIFFTGAQNIPPEGYPEVVLSFDSTSHYPSASTCALELTLPTKHSQYEYFKKQLDIAFTMHGGFGKI